MEINLFTGLVHCFLLNREGFTEEQIAQLQADPKFRFETAPRIETIAFILKQGSQNIEAIEQNKMLLLGGSNA